MLMLLLLIFLGLVFFFCASGCHCNYDYRDDSRRRDNNHDYRMCLGGDIVLPQRIRIRIENRAADLPSSGFRFKTGCWRPTGKSGLNWKRLSRIYGIWNF